MHQDKGLYCTTAYSSPDSTHNVPPRPRRRSPNHIPRQHLQRSPPQSQSPLRQIDNIWHISLRHVPLNPPAICSSSSTQTPTMSMPRALYLLSSTMANPSISKVLLSKRLINLQAFTHRLIYSHRSYSQQKAFKQRSI
jgi:hypothetical protein